MLHEGPEAIKDHRAGCVLFVVQNWTMASPNAIRTLFFKLEAGAVVNPSVL